MHKSKILNFLDPRVKSDKNKTMPETDSTHSPSKTESTVLAGTHSEAEQQSTAPTTGLTGTSPEAIMAKDSAQSHAIGGTSASTTTPREAEVSHGLDATSASTTTTPKVAETAPTSKASEVPSIPANTTTGSSVARVTSDHTDAANAADGKGGILTGEKAKHGDPSNPYSAVPLDPRVDMPGTYPESSNDLTK
jgi:hypothetical protein